MRISNKKYIKGSKQNMKLEGEQTMGLVKIGRKRGLR